MGNVFRASNTVSTEKIVESLLKLMNKYRSREDDTSNVREF